MAIAEANEQQPLTKPPPATKPVDADDRVFVDIIPFYTKVWGFAMGLGMLGVIIWSFLSPLHDVVPGQAIFYYGLESLQTSNNGIIKRVEIHPGQHVTAGQVVAYLQQPELEKQVEQVKAKLELKRSSNLTLTGKEIAVRLTSMDAISRQIANYADTRKDALADVENLRGLTGGIAWSDLRLEQRRSMINAEEQLRQMLEADSEQAKLISFDLPTGEKTEFFPHSDKGLSDLLMPDMKYLDAKVTDQERARVGEDAVDRLVEIRDLEAELEQLLTRLEDDSVVKSPYNGTVMEVRLNRNEVLKSGASLALLEVTPEDLAQTGPPILVADNSGKLTSPSIEDHKLRVIAFLPAATAKKAKIGDPVRIQPGYLDKKAFGYMEGEVAWISSYPATEERMKRLLRNPTVVSEMQQTGTILEFHIDIEHDGQGQQVWKSPWNNKLFRLMGSKDPVAVNSGTLCSVEVEVKKRRPAGLVFPIFE